MMPRKKRRALLLSIILAILLIIVIVFLVLYKTTDMFRSKDILFNKYIVQLFDNAKVIFDESNMSEMQEILSNNKLESNTSIKIGYNENGNTENSINNIQINVDEKKEEKEKYDYKNISINQNEETLIGAEYLQNENVAGIRLKGIKQFVSSNTEENDNKISIFDRLINTNIKDIIGYSDEELQNLQKKYINIISSNLTISDYSKQKDVVLEINGQRYKTNEYRITITKEKFNDIYIKILEQLKEDEIVLAKIENIDNKINEYYKLSEVDNISNYKEEFINKVNTKIEEIKNANIGNDERKISVFETNGTAISLSIDTENDFFGMDVINTNENNFINILGNEKVQEEEKENSFNFKVEKKPSTNNEEIKMNFDVVEEGEKITNQVIANRKIENSEANNDLEFIRNVGQNSLQAKIEQKIKIVNNFKQKEELKENDNNIMIEKLEEEQKENIKNSLNENITNQKNNLLQVISLENINNILIKMNLKEETAEDISSDGNVTEAERIRFNSNYEFYQGEEIEKDKIIDLINATKDNLADIRITKYDETSYSTDTKIPLEYKIVIKKGDKNSELADNLINYIEENSQSTFSVRLEYDENTKLINNIFIAVPDDD